ncbi:hypothetical protein HMP0721_1000 [Pseudoramibacter alactolyticus ATCC 23263]|uniref:Uncharacterized protein n=1 Tax=Pseudoramibacter alactolyticus ATCC 23263 TaxID=887929 RepID=E6MG67_9FIRM|nr:hypothetical protein [Pseudoramibacter alactolyticus]EFV01607.1 hypothetical protein HMP0721_1000 [Pseudoramibacter alactolyticus ATCC 23263]
MTIEDLSSKEFSGKNNFNGLNRFFLFSRSHIYCKATRFFMLTGHFSLTGFEPFFYNKDAVKNKRPAPSPGGVSRIQSLTAGTARLRYKGGFESFFKGRKN